MAGSGETHLNLLVIISSLSRGGAEGVCATLCNQWAEAGNTVTIVLLSPQTIPPAYLIRPEIKIKHISVANKKSSFLRTIARILQIRQLIRHTSPNHVVSFMTETNVQTLIASRWMRVKVSISERVHPGFHTVSRSTRQLRRVTYRWADQLIVQSKDIQEWFETVLKLSAIVLPNPIKFDDPAVSYNSARRTNTVLAVGRLTAQKDYPLMIEAVSKAFMMRAGWLLRIAGIGPDREYITAQIEDRGLKGRVELLGDVANLSEAYSTASFFLHTAKYEGFPNVILEAMHHGLPVLTAPPLHDRASWDRLPGLRSSPERTAASLSSSIINLIDKPETRVSLGKDGRNAAKKFSAPLVAKQWLDVLKKA